MGTVQKPDQPNETITQKIDKKQCHAANTELGIDTNNVQSLPSMTSLIIWNISKALEIKSNIGIKDGIKAAQERLQSDSGNVISQNPEEQHFMCALLAWQKLGHSNADSLHEFLKAKNMKGVSDTNVKKLNEIKRPKSFIVNSINLNSNYDSEQIDSVNLEAYSKGPVIKLPMETKIIMRMDKTPNIDPMCFSHARPKTTKKLDDACCMDTSCGAHLAKMDADTEKLRTRAKLLAKREAQRAELLERAEAAWKDLERGYERRLTLAKEKEEDISKQIKKTVEDRNEYKKACTALTQELTERGKEAEKERSKLKEVEAELCNRACKRLKLSEMAAEVEAALADQQCKAVQLERDLQLKEDQARRKVVIYESETENARALTNETERALRAELSALREQITDVSKELLKEEEQNKNLKTELESLRIDKMAVIEALDGCHSMCDSKLQPQMDEIQNKREQLKKLKETVLKCKCKIPVDVVVEVKRTPSLAALCRCTTAENRILEGTCSCTSIRSSVISNLLADLFGGLQSELNGAGSEMPCKFLKCLEDQHNWDRASDIKSSLRNYFSNLLVGELDVAIATSIENYHAKWIGPACADLHRMIPGPDDDTNNQGWERRAIERKAQQLATKLAEDLYEKRAEQLTKRAKEIVTSGPPPCQCNRSPSPKNQTAVYPCLMESMTVFTNRPCSPKLQRLSSPVGKLPCTEAPYSWRRTHRDVTQLRLEIEGLKKDTITKKDLAIMENKIAEIVKRAAAPENEDSTLKCNPNNPSRTKKEAKYIKNTDDLLKTAVVKKKPIETSFKCKKSQMNEKPTKQPKKYNYHQTYAVNLCLCEQNLNKPGQNSQLNANRPPLKQKLSKEILSHDSSITHIQPVCILSSSEVPERNSKISAEPFCPSNCKCLQKEPSTSSIDKLLEKLTQWKYDLGGAQDKLISNMSKSLPNKCSKRILKYKDYLKLNYSTEKEKKGSESEIHKKNYVGEKKLQPKNIKEPINTDSEYIVAINLDKSTEVEVANKCATPGEYNNKYEHNDKSIIKACLDSFKATETEFKHPSNCMETQQQPYPKRVKKNESLCTKTKHTTKFNVLNNSKTIGTMSGKLKVKEVDNETNLNTDGKDKINMLSKHYYIKFLGVSLADVNSNKVAKSYVNDDNDKGNNYSPPSSYTSKENDGKNQNVMRKSERLNSTYEQKPTEENIGNSCKNNKKTNMSFINSFNDQCKMKNTHKKDINSESHKQFNNNVESCVCCNTKVMDCSKDLEFNVFNLLEIHLKEKLKEFQIYSCNSSCISPGEEEKIFCTILKKVKQVISDCVKEVKCNEPGRLSTGSWKRAYGLLQEYLKIKVKRAQCLSLSNEDRDVILPEILDKVCNLIENDFQRIKDICKCKKQDETISTAPKLLDHLSSPNKELPEKDTNISFKRNATVKMVSQQNSPKSSILRLNMSSQINSDLRKETKSFGVMVETNNIAREVSQEYFVKSFGLLESNPIAFTQNLPIQVSPNLKIETKSCAPMVDMYNIVKMMSVDKLCNNNVVTQHTSQVPVNLGMKTKACDANNIAAIVSRGNSAQSIVLAQHMSSQVPPNLGMESKSCATTMKSKNNYLMVAKENSTNLKALTNQISNQAFPNIVVDTKSGDIMTTGSESGQASETNTVFISNKTSRGILCNDIDYIYTKREMSRSTLPLFGNQKTLLHLRADILIVKSKDKNLGLRNVKSLPNFEFVENNGSNVVNDMKWKNSIKSPRIQPYVGCTVDCICDSKLKSCTCAKSLIQRYEGKFIDHWQQITQNKNNNLQNYSYIMNGNRNKNNDGNVIMKDKSLSLNDAPIFVKQHSNYINACEAEINVRNEKDNIISFVPKQTKETIQRSTNTYKTNSNLESDIESEDPFSSFIWKSKNTISSCPPQPPNSYVRTSADSLYERNEESSCVPSTEAQSAVRFTDSLLFCVVKNSESKLSSKSRSNSDTTETLQNCNCDKVPLCHVKMLVENIERNLKQCT